MANIEAKNLFKVFGRSPQRGVDLLRAGSTKEELLKENMTAAVIDVSFTARSGEIFVAMGLSGSGKSTLIRMVNGLLPPTAGEMYVDGEDVNSLDAAQLREVRRQKVSMVFQHFALLPHQTVGANAAYALKLQGIARSDREERARRALRLVGLEGWEDRLPEELSGGMRQRVGLARALAAETQVMLMDEAFSALDPLIRREMQDLLLGLQSELGKTIMFITHDLNEAMRLGHQIAMLRDGRVEQLGSAQDILSRPANDYVALFVRDVDRTRILTAESAVEECDVVVSDNDSIAHALEVIRGEERNHVVVLDPSGGLRGIVHRALLEDLRNRGSDPVASICRPTQTISAERPLVDLFGLLTVAPFVVPVVDEGDRFIGTISRESVVSALGNRATETGSDAPGPRAEPSAVALGATS